MIWFEFLFNAFMFAAGIMLHFVGRFYAVRAQGCLGVGFFLSMAYLGAAFIVFTGMATAGSEMWIGFWFDLVSLVALLIVAGCGWLLWSMRAARARMAALGGFLGKGAGFVLEWVAILSVCYSLWAAADLALEMLGY